MPPATNHDRARRLDALRAALADQGLAAAVLSRPEHLFYLTGTLPGPSPAFLIVKPDQVVAAAPSSIQGCETILYADYDIWNGWDIIANASEALSYALVAARLSDRETVGLETAHLPAVLFRTICDRVGGTRDIGTLMWSLRRIKDASEIAQIEANVAGNDTAFRAIREAIRPGITEIDLWATAYHAVCNVAGGSSVLEADLGAGPRTDNPDVKPTPAKLVTGDHVLVDIYSANCGYYADTTRVFVLGEPNDRQREIHSILAEALQAGEAASAPGVLACDVDAAVRGVIERAGYGDEFPHHSGHAYGLFQQERPYLIPAEEMPLEMEMVVTIEPGIYLSGWGGMRLEGSYVITGDSARRLDQFPSELIVC